MNQLINHFPTLKPWLLGFVIVTIGAGVCARILIRKGRIAATHIAEVESKFNRELVRQDLRILETSKSVPSEINQSLNRLSQNQDQRALSFLSVRASHESPETRAETAKQLGHYANDKMANQLLSQLIVDDDPAVRAAALLAIQNKWNQDRKKLLLHQLTTNKKLSIESKSDILQVLGRRTSSSMEINQWVNPLRETLGKVKAPNHKANLTEILVRVPSYKKYLSELTQASADILRSMDSSTLQDAAKIKILFLLKRICPRDRFNLMLHVARTSSNVVVHRLVAELPFHGETGERVFREIINMRGKFDSIKSFKPELDYQTIENSFKPPRLRDYCDSTRVGD